MLPEIMSKLADKLLESRLNPHEMLDEIGEVATQFRDHWDHLSKNQVDALKARAEIQFKLLNKVLPDLRSIEQTVEPQAPVKFVIQTTKPETISVKTEVEPIPACRPN